MSAPATIARAFIVTSRVGISVKARQHLDSETLAKLPWNYFFHGEPVDDAWVQRLKSEGGGYCFRVGVKELP